MTDLWTHEGANATNVMLIAAAMTASSFSASESVKIKLDCAMELVDKKP